jgi:DNA-binding transcriptional LysR family regulator
MDIKLLRHFQVVANELHFGRAARQLDVLPSALGRNIRLLEEELGTRLFIRSTRNVALTRSGFVLQREVAGIIDRCDDAVEKVREAAKTLDRVFRIGAIDSAATGLIPQLMHDFREIAPDLEIVLVEDKTARLLPKMLNGALDVAFVRPPMSPRPQIHFEDLLKEPTVVALPPHHPLADRDCISITDLAKVPQIVPSPRNRPHSYDLTMRLFRQAGLEPIIAQQAEEKQTIVNLVGADLGAALVPYWTSRIGVEGVVYRPLVDKDGNPVCELPLAVAWIQGSKDENRDRMIDLVKRNLLRYSI